MYKGVPQNDIGRCTDVISNVPKSVGINMLIRSMSPQIIICDEIGTNEDILAIRRAFTSGVKGIFSAHASSLEEIKYNKNLKSLIEEKLIQRVLVLDNKNKGKIKEIL